MIISNWFLINILSPSVLGIFEKGSAWIEGFFVMFICIEIVWSGHSSWYSRHEKHYSFAYYSFVPLVSGSRMKLPLPTTKTSDSCSTHPRRGFCSSFALLFLKALCCCVLISCYFLTIISYKSVCAIACYQNLIKKWGETLKKVAELFQTKQVFECFELWFTTTHQPTKLV